MTDVNDTLQAADRTAARLRAQYPDTDINDKALVIDRCLEFNVDLRPGSGLAYAYDNVHQRALEYQLLASAAFASYELDGLHRYAGSIYDRTQDIEQESHEFFTAQAIYRLARHLKGNRHGGPQPQS
jgi:hypothetical protein